MTETAIEAVTMQGAAEALRDKIRLGFAELIPVAQWEAMINKELEAFLSERSEKTWNGPTVKPSVFREVCDGIFREQAKAAVKEALAKPEWQGKWDPARQKDGLSSVVEAWLSENADKLFHVVVQETVGVAAQRFIDQLRGT